MVWVYGLIGRNSTELRAGDDLTLIVSPFSGVFQECILTVRTATTRLKPGLAEVWLCP